ncbi:hypothetical protein WKW80_20845 [Variovorax humicola]|uniref:Uncharacterized protein n=1 Tax=Variovorax humicola TaxID=1769758 RepID=A0ABU8W329_9BURK
MMPRNLLAAALAASLGILPQAEAQPATGGKRAGGSVRGTGPGQGQEGLPALLQRGPALQGISKRMTPGDITRQLMEPRGSMPKMYPTPIDDKICADLRSYLMQLP